MTSLIHANKGKFKFGKRDNVWRVVRGENENFDSEKEVVILRNIKSMKQNHWNLGMRQEPRNVLLKLTDSSLDHSMLGGTSKGLVIRERRVPRAMNGGCLWNCAS